LQKEACDEGIVIENIVLYSEFISYFHYNNYNLLLICYFMIVSDETQKYFRMTEDTLQVSREWPSQKQKFSSR